MPFEAVYFATIHSLFRAKNLDTSQELFDRFTYFVMYCALCCIELVVNTPQDVQCMYDKLLVWHALYEKV
jgi:hypothetical protein